MNWTLFLTCMLIAMARVTDMTLDTLRMAAVVQGRRLFAAGLGFAGSMIYLLAVAKVLTHFDHLIYAVAYAAGFAAGNYLGMTIESTLALGEQIISVFTREGYRVATQLRDAGHRVTEFEGRGRDGEIAILYIEAPRRLAKHVIAEARHIDKDCFYIVHDVRMVRSASSSPSKRMRIAA